MEKTIIIGGGVAGLCAGIFGQLSGQNCVILEKQKVAGGLLSGWSRGEYHIDNCMHWLVGTHPQNPLYDRWRKVGMLDQGLPIIKNTVFYESQIGREKLALHRDIKKTASAMLRLSPGDSKAISELLGCVSALAELMRSPRPRHLYQHIAKGSKEAKIYTSIFLRYGRKTLDELARDFHHPLLRAILTDFIGAPFSALSWIWTYASFVAGDSDLPKGGSVLAAKRLENRFLSLGGELCTGAEVKRILHTDNMAVGVELKSGELISGDAIICATDPAVTAQMLPDVASLYQSCFKGLETFSAIHLAFAVEEGALPFENTLIFDLNSQNPLLYATPFGHAVSGHFISPPQGRLMLKVYPPETGFAPRGECVVQCIRFVSQEVADQWISLSADKEKYKSAKQNYAHAVAEEIMRRFSSLHKMKYLDMWTPATYTRYTGAYRGAFLGHIAHVGAMRTKMPTKIPHLENVFLASAWQHAPSGLPVALQMGEKAAKCADAYLKALRKREGRRVPSQMWG
ncbi:MAG: NAD(P)/FAD-dependent oxidoreductase [Clostridia bacterium]|nr:NAD(P)/FAD-dependent oxidoreductase [Clostridia bacterium]